ncbi:MAG: tetratricopeptide repeat protein [Nitrospiraceae bacterium]|nr:MAG: tetratricopeptide repeat protein [Nitrospiraceae bacterium]
MPRIIKKKPVKKKPLKEPEVKTAALEALDLMKQRRKQAIIIISVIAAAALLLVIFKFYVSSQNQKAHSFELEAAKYYYREKPYDALPDEERWKKALDLYKKSVEVKATPSALFYLGNSYYNLGDYENAIKQYDIFTDKFSKNHAVLPLVYQKLASAYFRTGKNDRALETLGNLSKAGNGVFRDTALHLEANYYESAGDTVKAMEKYKALADEFPGSPWAGEATAKIAQSAKKENTGAPGQAVEGTTNK